MGFNNYKALVERVMDIDPEAADYLATDAMDLESFAHSSTVLGSFVWAETPQGHAYWEAIAVQLEEIDDD